MSLVSPSISRWRKSHRIGFVYRVFLLLAQLGIEAHEKGLMLVFSNVPWSYSLADLQVVTLARSELEASPIKISIAYPNLDLLEFKHLFMY